MPGETSSTPAGAPVRVNGDDNQRFVARQPILDIGEQLFGYELLFRDGFENCFRSTDPDQASRSTLDSTLLFGLDVLCNGARAFVNCTYDVLLKGHVRLLPCTTTVIEVLESVPVDADIVNCCRELKESGYWIALDDYLPGDPRNALTVFADVIKVDVRETSTEDRAALVQRHRAAHCGLLAEKVETRQEFLEAKQQGFTYFQGYFFRKPEILVTHDIPENRINYLRMLQAVARPELNLREIESLIKSEASLCYRLLRYLNSAAFAFTSEIRSVRHALCMLGEREIRRWVRLVATMAAGRHHSNELVISALVRARFCELLGISLRLREVDLFFLGLLSLMDTILDTPLNTILQKVRVDHEIEIVLLGGNNRLRPVYRLMLAQESGEWKEVAALARNLHLDEKIVANLHWQAMEWARTVSSLG